MDNEQVRKRTSEILSMSSEELIRDFALRREKRKRDMDTIMQKHFGSTFEKEFGSIDDVFKGLDAADPQLRRLALFAVLGPWSHLIGHNADSHVEKMALTDPVDDVRSAALTVLGALFSGSRDRRISSIMADVTKNETEHSECRRSAYGGLLDVLGLKPNSDDLPPFPSGVDWNLVDKMSS